MSASKTILIVDDEDDARAFAETVVTEMGDFNIVTANCGEGGLQKAREMKPDLIILDVMMPDKTGFMVFEELRRDPATAAIPVIMLTGVTEKTGIKFSADDMGEYIGAPPSAFLDKPVDPAELQAAVKRALRLS